MKIKYSLLEKWCKANLTSKEYDFLIHIAHYQDLMGQVKGIYYRDVCKACDMCKQTFYESLRSLQKKGIITYKSVNNDYDITILDNEFPNPESFKEGYINVTRKAFINENFRGLKGKEKILLMIFLKNTNDNSGSYSIGTKKFYDNYTDLLGVTKKVLRGYLHSLRKIFSIGIKNGMYYITSKKEFLAFERKVSETKQYLDHVVKADCRRSKIKEFSQEAFEETVKLVNQYGDIAKALGYDILAVIGASIYDSVSEVKRKVLNFKYVHKLVRKNMGLSMN